MVAADEALVQVDERDYTPVTAYTTDAELEVIAGQIRASHAEFWPDSEIVGLELHLEREREDLRYKECDKLIRWFMQHRADAIIAQSEESVLAEALSAARARTRQLNGPRDGMLRAMSAWCSTRDLGEMVEISHTAVRKVLAKTAEEEGESFWPGGDPDRYLREQEQEVQRLQALRTRIDQMINDAQHRLLTAADEQVAAGLPVSDYTAALLAEEGNV